MRFSVLKFTAITLGAVLVGVGCGDDDDVGTAPTGGAAGAASGGAASNQAGKSGSAGTPSVAGSSAVAGMHSVGGAPSGGAPMAGAAGHDDTTGGVGGDGSSGEAGETGAAGAAGAGGAPEANIAVDPTAKTLLSLSGSGAKALYFFGRDVPASTGSDATSACVDACLDTWPAFHESDPVLAAGLSSEDFSELVRPGGARQTTFKGWPLYLYAGDSQVGDRTGDGVDKLWHAVEQPFYSLILMRGTLDNVDSGLYLADARGHTIYRFIGDQAGTGSTDPVSTCTTQGCRNAWPVVAPSVVKPVSSLTGSFDAFIRPDTHAVQVAYAGLPIYTFAQDLLPGDKKGTEKANWVLATP